MAPGDGTEPIGDDEVLYRRVPVSQKWYTPGVDAELSRYAFNPSENDTTGICFSRAKYKTVEEAAVGYPGKRYYVAKLSASALRAIDIEIIPDPRPGDPGHCELRTLFYENRKSNQSIETMELLANNAFEVVGPYPAE
jgi:hypothetical protein